MNALARLAPSIHPIWNSANLEPCHARRPQPLIVHVYEETATGRVWYGLPSDRRMDGSFSSRDRLLYRIVVRCRGAIKGVHD